MHETVAICCLVLFVYDGRQRNGIGIFLHICSSKITIFERADISISSSFLFLRFLNYFLCSHLFFAYSLPPFRLKSAKNGIIESSKENKTNCPVNRDAKGAESHGNCCCCNPLPPPQTQQSVRWRVL